MQEQAGMRVNDWDEEECTRTHNAIIADFYQYVGKSKNAFRQTARTE